MLQLTRAQYANREGNFKLMLQVQLEVQVQVVFVFQVNKGGGAKHDSEERRHCGHGCHCKLQLELSNVERSNVQVNLNDDGLGRLGRTRKPYL